MIVCIASHLYNVILQLWHKVAAYIAKPIRQPIKAARPAKPQIIIINIIVINIIIITCLEQVQ